MKQFGVASLICVFCYSAAWAEGESTNAQLILQLGDKDYRTRETAAKSLEERGESALSAMRSALTSTDPEARQRLTQLVARIERTSLLAPRRVSLNVDQKPVAAVFELLAKQSGYKLACQQGASQLITLHVENMPFWRAIDLVCKQAGLGMQSHYDNTGNLTFYRVGRSNAFVSYSGPFRLQAASFHHSKTVDLNNAQAINVMNRQRNDTLTFMFQAIGEPKVPLMSLGQVRLETAIDDLGNSLIPPQNRVYEANYHQYYYGYRNPMLQSQVQLLGHGNAQYLRHLKGTLPVTFLAEQRPEITVDNIMNVKNKKFEGGQVVLDIDDVKEAPGKQIHIKATARRNAAEGQHDYTWTNSLGQRVELIDDKGQKFQCDGFNWDSGTPTSVSGTFQFGAGGNTKLGKPTKLVYYGWVTSTHQIEFEFQDLPLP